MSDAWARLVARAGSGEELAELHAAMQEIQAETARRLNGGDTARLLRIVWYWIERANNGVGGDVDDLIHELEQAGFGPPDE